MIRKLAGIVGLILSALGLCGALGDLVDGYTFGATQMVALLLLVGLTAFSVWLLRGPRKSDIGKPASVIENIEDDPIKIAKTRFAKGEISKEELAEILEMLSEGSNK